MVKKVKRTKKKVNKKPSMIQTRFGKVKRTGTLRNLSGKITKKPSKS